MTEPASPLVHRRTIEQPSTGWTDEQRALVRRGADLAKRNLALWSASVRRMDELVAADVPVDKAHRQSLEEAETAERFGHSVGMKV